MTETAQDGGFDRKKAVWGVLLVAIGAVLFLDQLDVVEIGSFWGWWPVVLIGIGLVWITVPSNRGQIASGVTMVLIGLWALACMTRWMGFSFGRSWPVLIAIGGLEMVVNAVLDRAARGRRVAKETGDA